MDASRMSVCAWVGVVGATVAAVHRQPVTVGADLVARAGDVLPGSGGVAVVSFGSARVSPSGGVAFTGTLADQRAFLCVDGQVVWIAPSAAFGGLETGVGVGPGGAFSISPVIRSADRVITQNGDLAGTGGEVPGVPGEEWQSLFRPSVATNGAVHFVSGTGSAWSLWSGTPAGVFTRLVGSGDVIDGVTLASAITADAMYAISPDGARVGAITFISNAPGQSLLVNGQVRFAYGSPTGSPLGDQWRAHGGVALNNAGDFVHFGRTTANAGNDYFMAYNGRIRARSLDTIGTREAVPAQTPVTAAGLTSSGVALYAWGTGTLPIYAGHAPVLRWRSVTVVKVGDRMDTTGDGVPEWTLRGVYPGGTVAGLEADALGRIPLRAGLEPFPGAGTVPAIIRVAVPIGYRCPADFNHDGRVDPSDVAEMVRDWLRDVGTGIATTDYDLSDSVTPGDVTGFVQLWFSGGC